MGNCLFYNDGLTKKQRNIIQNCKYYDIQRFSFENLNVWGKIIDVYDGDTYDIVFYRNDELMRAQIRAYGYNCAELKPPKDHPNREKEIKDGIRGRNRLIQLATNCKVKIEDEFKNDELKNILSKNTKLIYIKFKKGSTYGRYIADVYENQKIKTSFGDILIKEKLAVPSFGDKIDRNKLALI